MPAKKAIQVDPTKQCVASPTRRPHVPQRCTREIVRAMLCEEHLNLYREQSKAAQSKKPKAQPAKAKTTKVSKRAAEADDAPASKVGRSRPPAPPKQPIARVPFPEPQPAVVQFVTPSK